MALYHFSEDPSLERFVPRAPLARPHVEPQVWAIDDWHAPVYYVPRDCPRVCFWPGPATTEEDRERFFAYVSARMVVVIEAGWFERLGATRLYRYLMPDEPFDSLHDNGMYVSRQTVIPLRVDALNYLPTHLLNEDVELRVTLSLVPLGKAIIGATLQFSLIRMRNAIGWDSPAIT